MDPTVGTDVQIAGGAFLLLFLCGVAWTVIMFICWGKIGKKCGFSFWWTAILMFLPIANVIMLLFLGYSKRPPLELADPKPEKKMQKDLDDLKDRVTKRELDDMKDRMAKLEAEKKESGGKTGAEFCGGGEEETPDG